MLSLCLSITGWLIIPWFHYLQYCPNSLSNQYVDFLNSLCHIFEVVTKEIRTKKNPRREFIKNSSQISLNLLYVKHRKKGKESTSERRGSRCSDCDAPQDKFSLRRGCQEDGAHDTVVRCLLTQCRFNFCTASIHFCGLSLFFCFCQLSKTPDRLKWFGYMTVEGE